MFTHMRRVGVLDTHYVGCWPCCFGTVHRPQKAFMTLDTIPYLWYKHSQIGAPLLQQNCPSWCLAPPCHVQVRHARVEDHDDLLPIVAAAAAGSCPSLAALPQSCQPDQPFALTRLISSQDSHNLVLVAEDEGKLVSQVWM